MQDQWRGVLPSEIFLGECRRANALFFGVSLVNPEETVMRCENETKSQ